ncbi:MAG: TRL-like protein family [Deltaproteobacteria bacterium]|nr:MAG: TRL-like protein family [Deltaproteobacteria bacterium]
MKKILYITVLLIFAVFISGCATNFPVGVGYTRLKLPVTATSSNEPYSKVGVAQCTSILGLVATGDASIEAAMKNGNITKIHHIDWDVENFFGVYGKYTITVYGE